MTKNNKDASPPRGAPPGNRNAAKPAGERGVRVNVFLASAAQHAKFKALGGSHWLQGAVDRAKPRGP